MPGQPRTCSSGRSRSARPFPQQIAWSQAPVLLGVCHSNATRPKEVLGFMFEKLSRPGAPLRNRTVDLLLTMDRCAVLQPKVDRLTCVNTSTHWHSQAPDKPTRAPFATQSATHFDLVSERANRRRTSLRKRGRSEAEEVRKVHIHRLSLEVSASTRLLSGRPGAHDVEHCGAVPHTGRRLFPGHPASRQRTEADGFTTRPSPPSRTPLTSGYAFQGSICSPSAAISPWIRAPEADRARSEARTTW